MHKVTPMRKTLDYSNSDLSLSSPSGDRARNKVTPPVLPLPGGPGQAPICRRDAGRIMRFAVWLLRIVLLVIRAPMPGRSVGCRCQTREASYYIIRARRRGAWRTWGQFRHRRDRKPWGYRKTRRALLRSLLAVKCRFFK